MQSLRVEGYPRRRARGACHAHEHGGNKEMAARTRRGIPDLHGNFPSTLPICTPRAAQPRQGWFPVGTPLVRDYLRQPCGPYPCRDLRSWPAIFARSLAACQVVRWRSAKPLLAGSIPAAASKTGGGTFSMACREWCGSLWEMCNSTNRPPKAAYKGQHSPWRRQRSGTFRPRCAIS